MFRTIAVILSANTGSFVTQMRTAGGALDDFGDRGDRTAVRSEASAGRASKAWMAVGVVVASGLIGAGVAAASFEQRMRNVNSISGQSEEAFRKQGQAVLDLSKTLPQSANTLAEGLYDIASSGFQGAEGLEVLEASAKAASAGLSTTAEAGKAITAVLNAYGLAASDADRVSDVLFQTVNLGVINFSELSSVIGDTVGVAAAAGISIEEVGAAVATMTLSGVTAAEAGTSLNRVIQSFIKPSDAMKTAMTALGHESGFTALKTLGLRGAVTQLWEATDGSVEALAEMFDEQRALRGVLGLTSGEMANYNRVTDGMGKATEGVGATQRAFSEQMKSVSAQLKIAKNEVVALAIEGATPLLGFFSKGITEGRGFAEAIGGGVVDAITRARPFFAGLAAAGGDVIRMLGNIITGIEPLAVALGALGGGAAIGTLNTLATGLAGLADIIADNSEIVAALAILYGTNLALGVAGAAAQFLVWRASAVASTVAASGLTAAVTTQAGAFAALGAVMKAVPLLAIVGAISSAISTISQAGKEAEGLARKLEKGLDLSKQGGLDEYLKRINDQREGFREVTNEGNRFTRFLRVVADTLPGVDTGLIKAQRGYEKLGKAQQDAARESISFQENVNTIRHATGLSAEAVEALAQRLGVDLTQSFGKSGDARQKIINDFNGLKKGAEEAGISIGNIGPMTKEGLEELAANIEAAKKALDEAVKRTDAAFDKSFDLVSNYATAAKEHERATDGVTAAQERLEEAQKALSKLRARQAGDDKQTIADAQALEAAENQVAEAERGVASAREAVTAVNLSGFFATQVAEANKFATDIRAAAELGLDPAIIQKLLEAGPAQAAPFLEGMMQGNVNRNIEMANESQRTLGVVNAQMLEMARATHRAITGTNEDMLGEYDRAMKFLEIKARSGGQATADAIAEETGIGVDRVREIAKFYGIRLAEGINPVLDAVGAKPIAFSGWESFQRFNADGNIYYAKGGVAEDHVAQIAPAGAWRVWAEDETGGEAYIPLAESKRDRSTEILRLVAERFGMELVAYHEGGFLVPSDVPRPPDTSMYGTMAGYSGTEVNKKGYDEVLAWVTEKARERAEKEAAAAAGAVGDGKIGEGWRAITDYLDKVGQAYTITSTYRPGSITSSGNLSNHALGKAVDMVGDMRAIFNTLLNIGSSLSELFWDPAGFSVKNGVRANFTVGGHDDHVHAATFDNGGSLYPGMNRVYNGTGAMEHLAPVSRQASTMLNPLTGAAVVPDVDAMIAAVVDGVLKQVEITIPLTVDNREIARAAGNGSMRRSRELG